MPDTKVCPQCGRTYPSDDRFCTVDGAGLLLSGHDDTLIGAVLAERYLVREKLGEGGMGEVYLAEHVRMKRKVAVKLMRRWMATDPVAVSRFHREAENASQIAHPNVAQVYDFGETEDGIIYLAMEFVPGEPLSKILEREGRLHAVRAAEIVRQTADALVAAHHMGILHRDLKPDNVMVARTRTGTDIVKLVDFGIARAMNRGTQQVTSTGMIVGTPDYMSPEQFTGDTLDERSDLYALALIAFRALTGRDAFPEGAASEALVARLTNNSRRLAAVLPDVPWPEQLQAAFDRALAAKPQDRYDNALQFAIALDVAVAELPLSAEEQAYVAALSQRMVTPARVGVVKESPTPSEPRFATAHVATPAERPLIVADNSAGSSARAPIPSVPATPDSPPDGSTLREVDRPLEGAAMATDIGDAPPDAPPSWTPDGAAGTLPRPRSRRPAAFVAIASAVGIAIVALAAQKLTSGATESVTPLPSVISDSGVVAAMPPPVDTARITSVAAAPVPSDSEHIGRARQAVFAVSSSAGRATAVLVDTSGIVLTSANVVPDDPSRPVDLYFEAESKVRGTVLSVDSVNGVAALLVPLRKCRRCRALDLLGADSALQPVEGDTVLALSVSGRTTLKMTRTEVGKVSPRTFSARGRVQAANAGAPLFSARTGTVVALASRRKGGTNTILVPARFLRDGLAKAKSLRARKGIVPNDSVFRSWPARPVDNVVLEEAARRRADELVPYRAASSAFAMLAMTPQVMVWRATTYGAATTETNPFEISSPATRPPDPVEAWSEWKAYRSERRAVVAFHVAPDKSLIPELAKGVVDFKSGDFVSMKLLRDKQELVPLETARIPAVANVQDYRDRGKVVYSAGIYVYHPADFGPRPDGRAAEYEALITDARRPDRPASIRLPAAMLQAITRDVGGWMR